MTENFHAGHGRSAGGTDVVAMELYCTRKIRIQCFHKVLAIRDILSAPMSDRG